MIEFLIAAGIGALAAHAKNQTFEGKLEALGRDLKAGKIKPEQAQARYQSIVQNEIDKIPADGIPTPQSLKEAFENGLDYKQLASKVDPETYNALHAFYWNGDWDCSKRPQK